MKTQRRKGTMRMAAEGALKLLEVLIYLFYIIHFS